MGPRMKDTEYTRLTLRGQASLGDGRLHSPLFHKVRTLKYVRSFEKMLYKCMVMVEEYLLFTESDQNFLVTSLCLGKNKSVSQRRQRVAV